MRILVIDDNETHRKAAKAQLKNHELTVVGSYDEGQERVAKGHKFEAVLVDLLMPASGQSMGSMGQEFVDQEMPNGVFLAVLAAKNGAKYAAVFTDSDHHSHPASACFDAFNPEGEGRPESFTVNGGKVILCNDRNLVETFRRDDLAKAMSWNEAQKDKGRAVRTKNWAGLLSYLTAPSTKKGRKEVA
ncbi:MAG: hypothetical protein AAB691_03410 [Patescibacteria group bacterium]